MRNDKAIITGWSGSQFAKMACYTVPIIEEYSYKHESDFYCVNMEGERPASWSKVTYLSDYLKKYKQVAWIDSDVVIEKSDKSIFDDVGEGFWQGLVPHKTPDGIIPNCGIWVLRPQMIDILSEIWQSGKYINHPWWEQACILEKMGFEVCSTTAKHVHETELLRKTAWLSSEWNHHPRDLAKVDNPRFRHVTQYPDRISAVRYFITKSDSQLQFEMSLSRSL